MAEMKPKMVFIKKKIPKRANGIKPRATRQPKEPVAQCFLRLTKHRLISQKRLFPIIPLKKPHTIAPHGA